MEINVKTFYTTGIVCFLIIGVANFANFLLFFSQNNIFSRIGGLAGVVFNFVIAGFFYYLLGTQQSNLPQESEEDLEDAIKEFEND